MKKIVRVSVFEFALQWRSSHYINRYSDYDLKCNILSRDLGVFWDKYVLQLEGSPDNIQLFLDYLKCEKFKIN